MVKGLSKGGVTLYLCEACDFAYRERDLAQRCQQWCQQHHSCIVTWGLPSTPFLWN